MDAYNAINSTVAELRDKKERGVATEFLFFRALQASHLELPRWFRSSRRATPEEDYSRGIDAVVELDVGQVKVQIKTSDIHRAKYEKAHPGNHVLVIVLGANITLEEARKKILKLLFLRRGEMMRAKRSK